MSEAIDLGQYRKDARGALVPVDSIKTIDLVRDDLVHRVFQNVVPVREELVRLKQLALQEIRDFIELSANEYGVQLGGKKGNVTLTSFDGEFRLMVAMSDTLAFDERLQAAKKLIDHALAQHPA